jgi:hypothetical protein
MSARLGNPSTLEQSPAKLYFGYGSNLSVKQMHQRCPNSHYVGIGRLKGYKWIINSRGYANVVELPRGSSAHTQNEVWGLIFYLTPDDEANLDINEGVPTAYTKEMLRVDFWNARLHDLVARIDITETLVIKEALVYVDRKRMEDDKPKSEYVVRMNRGIDDALAFGVPETYVESVMRKFIPGVGTVGRRALEKAERQALEFRDEYDSE